MGLPTMLLRPTTTQSFPRNIDFIFPQQGPSRLPAYRQKPLLTGDDLTYVERMKCVYIFIWPNGVQHLFLGNMLRQGQLHKMPSTRSFSLSTSISSRSCASLVCAGKR